jgi:hypothetical protein
MAWEKQERQRNKIEKKKKKKLDEKQLGYNMIVYSSAGPCRYYLLLVSSVYQFGL